LINNTKGTVVLIPQQWLNISIHPSIKILGFGHNTLPILRIGGFVDTVEQLILLSEAPPGKQA
jgi:hypothetical protein